MFIARCGATVFVVKQFIVCVPIYFLVAASAGAAGPLTLSEAEALALHDEPGQARLQAQSDAVAEKAVAGGQLADPRMRAGLMNLPIESGGFTTEGMSQVQFGVRQAFPPGRTLQWRTAQLERKAQALALLSNSRKRDVIAAVRHAWLGVYYWTHAREIVSANRPLFSDLVDVTRALYTVGRRNQQDLMQAELERSRIDDRLLMIDQSIGEARSELARWIGSDPAQRAVGPALPEWDDAPGLVELQHNLQSFPALTAATQEVAAGEAGINLAEQRYKPGWALDV
ncbi:MAG: TolC family protein, partial [Gammaproteobacteria bacterium]|nr:TolC family protein [Gammaproteobacteria bacterium]